MVTLFYVFKTYAIFEVTSMMLCITKWWIYYSGTITFLLAHSSILVVFPLSLKLASTLGICISGARL